MENKELVTIDEEVQEEKSLIIQQAAAMVVDTTEAYDEARGIGGQLKDIEKKLNEIFGPAVKKAHEAHKAIKALQNAALKPVTETKTNLAGKMNVFSAEQRRKEQEEEKKQQEEANRLAKEERERLEAEAEKAYKENDDDGFDKANYEAQQVTPESVAPVSQPKTKLAGAVENWTYEIINKDKLIAAVAAGTASSELLEPNHTALLKLAKAVKNTVTISGVKFRDKGSTRF